MPMTMSMRPSAKTRDDLFVLLGAAKAADHIDDDRILRHALAKGIEVLLAEHRGWYQHGGLLAREHSLEHRADRDFGFSEANVAANQAVHRQRAFHVGLGWPRWR